MSMSAFQVLKVHQWSLFTVLEQVVTTGTSELLFACFVCDCCCLEGWIKGCQRLTKGNTRVCFCLAKFKRRKGNKPVVCVRSDGRQVCMIAHTQNARGGALNLLEILTAEVGSAGDTRCRHLQKPIAFSAHASWDLGGAISRWWSTTVTTFGSASSLLSFGR